MALESSGGLRSSSTPKLRSSSLLLISAGAALVALIGYLYVRKQERRQSSLSKKQPKPNTNTSTSTAESSSVELPEVVVNLEKTETATVEENDESLLLPQLEEARCLSKAHDSVDLEQVSQQLVQLVLNCATQKLTDINSITG